MKRILRVLPVVCLAASAILMSLSARCDAQAFRFGYGFGFGTPSFHHASPYGHGYAPSYPETYHYWNSNYPKYYNQFHHRNIQNLGVSPGDIGLRGNGIMFTPW